MDKLPESNAIWPSLQGTFAAYEPLLLAKKDEILATPKTTHQYGSHERQKLDLYEPAKVTLRTPVLVWLYGGGFVHGGRTISSPKGPYAEGLVYANVAHFYAKNFGFLVAIIDYRLISHGATYPSGGEDLGLALKWLAKHLGSEKHTERSAYIMGNSAGGVHLATWMFAPELADLREDTRPLHVQAVVLLSAPFDQISATADRADTNRTYYGDAKQIKERVPTGLLVNTETFEDHPVRFHETLEILAVTATRDPEDEILKPLTRFLAEAKKYGVHVETQTIQGHNHISPPLALGTGIAREEEWGFNIGTWLTRSSESTPLLPPWVAIQDRDAL